MCSSWNEKLRSLMSAEEAEKGKRSCFLHSRSYGSWHDRHSRRWAAVRGVRQIAPDRGDLRSSEAEASSGGSTSSRGAGALFDQVEVDTKDCGPLVLRRGVTEQNKQQIADELSSAGRVQFRMGAGLFKWREVLHTFRTPVIVQSYVAHG